MRFEEYIVGILSILISALLRRLHLPEHQATYVNDEAEEFTVEEIHSDETEELTAEELRTGELRSLPLRSCSLTRLRI